MTKKVKKPIVIKLKIKFEKSMFSEIFHFSGLFMTMKKAGNEDLRSIRIISLIMENNLMVTMITTKITMANMTLVFSSYRFKISQINFKFKRIFCDSMKVDSQIKISISIYFNIFFLNLLEVFIK